MSGYHDTSVRRFVEGKKPNIILWTGEHIQAVLEAELTIPELLEASMQYAAERSDLLVPLDVAVSYACRIRQKPEAKRLIRLEEEVEAVRQDVDVVANAQFRLPQAFRLGRFFEPRPVPKALLKDASDLGLDEFISGPVPADNSILLKAISTLTQKFGPRTSGAFQMGNILELLADLGYVDRVPREHHFFRQILPDLHLRADLVASIDAYYEKWRAALGLPKGSEVYFRLFAGRQDQG
jgi:hypothetical protein